MLNEPVQQKINRMIGDRPRSPVTTLIRHLSPRYERAIRRPLPEGLLTRPPPSFSLDHDRSLYRAISRRRFNRNESFSWAVVTMDVIARMLLLRLHASITIRAVSGRKIIRKEG